MAKKALNQQYAARLPKAFDTDTRNDNVKLERSAGVLLYHDSTEQSADDARRFLLLDYGSHWDYPKGHVELGEDDVTAARRELQEETGITHADLHANFKREIVYVFRGRRGELIKKTVVFFLARTHTTDVILSDEHVGFSWDSSAEALAKLTYANARSVLNEAVKTLK